MPVLTAVYATADTRRAFKDIQVPDPQRAAVWARTQLGKGYDYTAVLGLAIGRDSWQDDYRWHCAQLLEMSLVGRKRRFLDTPL